MSGKLSRNSFVNYKYNTQIFDKVGLVWEDLSMKSNRNYHVKYIKWAMYTASKVLWALVVWEYTWVPPNKVEARSQISKYRAKQLNIIVSGRQDSKAGYFGGSGKQGSGDHQEHKSSAR